MRLLQVIAGFALLVGCGSSQPATEPSVPSTADDTAAPSPTSPQELLATAQLRVSRVTLGALASGDEPREACGADVLFAEQGSIVVTVGEAAQDDAAAVWNVMPGEALLIPSGVRWSAVSVHGESPKKSTALHARASATTARCPRANEVLAYKNPPGGPIWHNHADGKLLVRVLVGGAGDEQLPMSLAELRAKAGFSVPPHAHEASDENLWISSGSGVMRVGDKAIEVHANQWIHVPKGVQHSFESDGSEPLVALQMYVPSGPEQRFVHTETVASEAK